MEESTGGGVEEGMDENGSLVLGVDVICRITNNKNKYIIASIKCLVQFLILHHHNNGCFGFVVFWHLFLDVLKCL